MNTTQDLTIGIAATNLANAARIGVELGGMSPEAALDMAAKQAVQTATDARTRSGIWSSETSSRQIEDALFQGSVARDVLDGEVSRPSTGNVRSYALGLI